MTSKTDDLIEACAGVVDNTAEELKGLIASPASRTSQYDRQTKKQLETALRWCERCAERVRALKGKPGTAAKKPNDEGLNLIAEIRPLLDGGRPSAWRKSILARIDKLLAER